MTPKKPLKRGNERVIPSRHSSSASLFLVVSAFNSALRSHVNANSGRYTHDMFALVITIGYAGSAHSSGLYRLMYGNSGSVTLRSFVGRLQTLAKHGLVVKRWSRGAYRYSLSPLCLSLVRKSVAREALRDMHAIVKDALR